MFQHWSLQAFGWGQVLVPKWWPPGELTPMNIPWYLHHQSPCTHSKPRLPHPHTSSGDPPRPTGGSGPGSYDITAFTLGSSTKCCVPSPRAESLSHPVHGLLQQAPLAFKARWSGGSSSWYLTFRLGSLAWDSELSLLWENFCDIIILQFAGCPLEGCGV